MKKFNLVLISLAIAAYAHADFIPGRQRVEQRSTYVNQVDAQGRFIEPSNVVIEGIREDGVALPVAFTISQTFNVIPIETQNTFTVHYRVLKSKAIGIDLFQYEAIEVRNDGTDGTLKLQVIEDSRRNEIKFNIDNNGVMEYYEGRYEELVVTL